MKKKRNNTTKNKNTGKNRISHIFRLTYDVSWNIILFFLIIACIGFFFAGGIGAGYFASLVKDEPVLSYSEMEKDIYNYEETSKLYYANDVYLGDVSSDITREEVALENVAEVLIQAVIATEDEYFYEHKGVVPKAIIRAIIQEATNANMKTGGSTLTQQLIKNQLLTNEVSFDRKAKEILLALRLEDLFEKEQILEAYLNVIPYGRNASGRNIAGIQTAAEGIFGVNADELNLPQAAYLAGLPQSPSAYTPFVSGGGLKDEDGVKPGIKRMKTVLYRMLESDFIDQDEYDKAIEYDIVADFTKGKKSPMQDKPFLTQTLQDEAKKVLIEVLAKEDDYTMQDLAEDKNLKEDYSIQADRALRMNGYKIYSTIDKDIYNAMQDAVKNFQHFGPDQTAVSKDSGKVIMDKDTGKPKIEQVEASAILRENKTGKILGFVAGRDFEKNQNNHAFNSSRSVGSTIKGSFVYPAAIEEGKIQPGTPIADIPTNYADGTPINNYGRRYYGIVSARQALENSYNVSAVRAYNTIRKDDIDDSNPVKKYLGKMNFHDAKDDKLTNQSVALGSFYASMKENVGAFATIGNEGKFTDGYLIDKITTSDGEVIYEHKQKETEVYSPQTSYLTYDMMRGVVNRGTAASVKNRLNYKNVDWAGKTGTADDYTDAWFVATNPNVSFGTWIGYDSNMPLNYCPGCSLTYSQRNIALWADIINAVSEVNPDLIAPSNKLKRPDGIVERSYCAISGDLPSELCKKAGLVQSDLFNSKHVPTKNDDSLMSGSYVTVDGKSVPAGSKTPKEFVNGDGLSFNPEFLKNKGYDKLSNISQLYSVTNTHLWEKISAPGGSIGSKPTDNGSTPAAPPSVKGSNSELTWNKPDSKNIVGYRIYSADEIGGSFKLIGSTTSTKTSIQNKNALYYVTAVDYFGRESKASKEVTIGDVRDPEKEKEEKKKEDEEEKEKEKEEEELKEEETENEEENEEENLEDTDNENDENQDDTDNENEENEENDDEDNNNN